MLKIICVCSILLVAVVMDIKTGKIKNQFLAGCTVYGLVFCISMEGIGAITKCLVGVAIPIILLMPLFYFRVIGAGDIKLYSAIGVLLGGKVFWVIVYGFLTCGIFGLMLLVGKLIKGWLKGNVYGVLQCFYGEKSLTRVAFSVFIALGFGCYLIGGL